MPVFYPPPPPFIGGRQPYAPQLGIPQSGPVAEQPPVPSRITLKVILDQHERPYRFIGGDQPYAPALGLIQSGIDVIQPPPKYWRPYWTIDAATRIEPWTIIGVADVAPQLTDPPAPDNPPKRTQVTLQSIIRQYDPPPHRPPPLKGIAAQSQAPAAAQAAPNRSNAALYAVLNSWVPPHRPLPNQVMISPILPAAPLPDAPPKQSYANRQIINQAWIPPYRPLPEINISAAIVPPPEVVSQPPALTYQNRQIVNDYWTAVKPPHVKPIIKAESGPFTLYPTVLVDLLPASAAEDVIVADSPLLTTEGNTVTFFADGSYTGTFSTDPAEYFDVEVFDDSTGEMHVMSPYRVYVDGAIRLADWTGLSSAAAVSTLEGQGLTVTTVLDSSDTYGAGIVIDQSEAPYSVLNTSITVTLTVSSGSIGVVSKVVFTVSSPRIQFS